MTDQPALPAPRQQPNREDPPPSLRSALVGLAGAPRDPAGIAGLLDLIVERILERVEPVTDAAIVRRADIAGQDVEGGNVGGDDVGDGDVGHGVGMVYEPALHIPLFAGSGEMVAILVLRGPDPIEMVSLGWRLRSLYESGAGPDRQAKAHPGTEEFVRGMAEALAVRDQIQLALGVLMELRQCSPSQAYLALVEQADATHRSVVDTANAILDAVAGRGPSPLTP